MLYEFYFTYFYFNFYKQHSHSGYNLKIEKSSDTDRASSTGNNMVVVQQQMRKLETNVYKTLEKEKSEHLTLCHQEEGTGLWRSRKAFGTQNHFTPHCFLHFNLLTTTSRSTI